MAVTCAAIPGVYAWFMSLASFRESARLQRGVLIIAPVFWSAVTVFLNPWFGLAGFAIHFFLCAPRGKTAMMAMALAYPLLSLLFAVRNPALTLESIPFHREFHEPGPLRFWTGEVADFPTAAAGGEGYDFLFENEKGLYHASFSEGKPPPLGATVLLLAGEESPEPPSNPGQRDPRYMLRAEGAASSLRGTCWIELKGPSRRKIWLSRLREKLGQSLARHVPASALPFAAATLLNDTRGISAATREDFLRSGMQHIPAINGQHIALLAAFLLIPSLCLRLPRKLAFLAAGMLVALYIPLTGAPVSAARAGIMLACFLPSVLLERPSPGFNAFCLAAAVDLLLSPFHVLNLGFQLSYAATLALILCAKPGRSMAEYCGKRFIGAVARMMFLSAMVTLFIYPILAVSTHAIAPWSVPGNLVTLPLSGALLIGGLCTWILSPFPMLAHWSGACTGLCSLLLEGSVHLMAGLPGALWPIAEPAPLSLLFMMISALTTAVLFRMNQWRLGFLWAAILIVVEIFRPCFSAPFPGGAKVTVLSVGHGDASVLELPGATILIDAGPSAGTARLVLIPFLQSRGLRRLDVVLLTHPDLDHYGGTFGLFNRISIGFILAPRIRSTDPSWNRLKAEAGRLGIAWKEGGLGDLLYQKGNVTLRILGPDSTMDPASDNNHSLVCLLQTSRNKVLFTGNIEGPAQRALAGTWPLWRGAWLKTPHHGSDRTTLPCFLTAVSPPKVAISSGRRPGFPGSATMAYLEGLHAEIGVTARDGAIQWEFPSSGNTQAQGRKFRMKL